MDEVRTEQREAADPVVPRSDGERVEAMSAKARRRFGSLLVSADNWLYDFADLAGTEPYCVVLEFVTAAKAYNREASND